MKTWDTPPPVHVHVPETTPVHVHMRRSPSKSQQVLFLLPNHLYDSFLRQMTNGDTTVVVEVSSFIGTHACLFFICWVN